MTVSHLIAGNFFTQFTDQIKGAVDGATKGVTDGIGSITSPGKAAGVEGEEGAKPQDFFSGLMSGVTEAASNVEKAAREVWQQPLISVCNRNIVSYDCIEIEKNANLLCYRTQTHKRWTIGCRKRSEGCHQSGSWG